MREAVEYLIRAIPIGIGATAFMDIVAFARTRLFNTPSANYALVGRWLAYCVRGQFRHDAIAATPPVRGEHLIGWSAHYVIGIAFATLLLAIFGFEWSCDPTLIPALIVGLASVAAPFLLMQPGMGAGIASSRSPNPAAARLRSLVAHAIFGAGLYVAAMIVNASSSFACSTAMIAS